MVETKSDPMAEVKSETPWAKQYAARLATDGEGNHGYEIGFWPEHADMNDPRLFEVVEKAYGQAEAFARVNTLNMGVADEPAPKVSSHEDDEDADHEAARERRAQHGPLRHKGR